MKALPYTTFVINPGRKVFRLTRPGREASRDGEPKKSGQHLLQALAPDEPVDSKNRPGDDCCDQRRSQIPPGDDIHGDEHNVGRPPSTIPRQPPIARSRMSPSARSSSPANASGPRRPRWGLVGRGFVRASSGRHHRVRCRAARRRAPWGCVTASTQSGSSSYRGLNTVGCSETQFSLPWITMRRPTSIPGMRRRPSQTTKIRPVVSLSSISNAGFSSLRFPTDVTDPAIVTSSPGTHDSMSNTARPGVGADGQPRTPAVTVRGWTPSVDARHARRIPRPLPGTTRKALRPPRPMTAG